MTDETTQALLPVKVTQADRDLIVTLMRPLAKSAIEHKAIDFIAEGRGDDAEAVQLVAKYRLAHSLPSQASERQNRLQKYLVDEAQARERLATFPDTVRQRLTRWQEGQSEWFGCTVLEIVAEFIAFEDATLTPTSGEEMRLREALEAITFLTCVSGDGPTPYLKVHFNDLAAAHSGHDALIAMKRGKS